MVSGRRKRKASRTTTGSHQRCWLWGRHLVLETLRAGRWRPLEVRTSDRLAEDLLAEVDALAAGLEIPVVTDRFDALTRRCGSTEHQGLLAQMPPFPWLSPEAALAELPAAPFILILDAVQDPYNFGAILRSAEVFGADAVIVGDMRQSEVTILTARASAGAVNHIRLARAADLVGVAQGLKSRGCVVVGASGTGTIEAAQYDFRRGCVLIIGNEGSGLSPSLESACDALVRIPQIGRIGSLNAAVAAGILCYEVRRQRS